LAALEEERFDEIGPPVFVKGYLKHYSDLLGLDPRPLLDELAARVAGGEPELKGRRPVEDEERKPGLLPFAAGVVVAAAAAIAWWQLGGSPDGAAESTAGDAGASPSVREPSLAPEGGLGSAPAAAAPDAASLP